MRPLPASVARPLHAAMTAFALFSSQALASPPIEVREATAAGVELQHVDTSVRPQDDFYRYVNGGWLATAKIPADLPRYGTFIELRNQSELALRAIIEEAAGAKRGSAEVRQIGALYRSYMDLERREALGLTPIRADLARIDALKSKLELPAYFAQLSRAGVGLPIGTYVHQDAKQASRYVLYATQSGLGMPDRQYYLSDAKRFVEIRSAYLHFLETLLKTAGVEQPGDAARKVLDFETRLATAQWDRVKNRDREATYNPHSVAELEARTPGFSWSTYLRGIGATRTPTIIVRQPDYLVAAHQALRDTPMPTLRNYLKVRVLSDVASYLTRDLDEAAFTFYGKVLTGAEEPRPHWKRGVSLVNGALGEAVGKLYVARHFSPESKTRMEVLVKNLFTAFEQSIDTLDWMGPATRTQAKEKLSRFTVKIGYPDVWRSYAGLRISDRDLIGNLKRSAEFEHRRQVGRLGKPIDRQEWRMSPQTVNAYYSSTMNEIVFPAAILQPPFFNPEADDAVNYGAIGGVIGHEISHGFDDQGSRSDGEGNLRNWWTDADREAFQDRTARLVAQYNAFSPMEGMHVNGALTLGENIGDLSGLTVAFRAYLNALGGKPAPELAGFSGPQRFFLGWAQVWRGLHREDYLRQMLTTDPHAPGEYRVNGVVRNMPGFYEAFGVKEGDALFLPAAERVKIW
ncbi:MAG TPA: M13-type metalloendopeptidase [Myxococcaceae bacterium]|nr:M13-type metalloendopeptidase [Myxococcaceae bacterium]